MVVFMRLLGFLLFVSALFAQQSQAASFTHIGVRSIDELNQVLASERKYFLSEMPPPKGYRLPSAQMARNEVDLYKVEYDSVIPEQGNRPTKAYGLLAIPKDIGGSARPFLSYQHGTVFGKYEVPSYSFLADEKIRYDNSYETRLAVAQFAGNGYVVFAADYFGMGDSQEPEGYMVKGSHQQACLDLYLQVKDWLATNKSISQSQLFLSGWSQGGYVTMAFLEKLEESGIPVTAASTAAAPADLFASFNGVIYNPQLSDAPWLSSTFSLSALAFQNYYQKPNLLEDVFKPEYLPSIRALYSRSYVSSDPVKTKENLIKLLGSLTRYDDRSKKYVPDIANLMKDEYQNPSIFALSDFGQLAKNSEVYRWNYKTPVKMFYGLSDEAVAPRVATLAADYQKAIGNPLLIVSKPVLKANHRATYLTASAKQVQWFSRFLDK